MIRNRTIRGILAAGLFGLFALAMTPKIAIHALAAHHRDVHLEQDLCVADQMNAASFHCATDNLVVELPFIYSPFSVPAGGSPCFPVHRPAALTALLCRVHPLYGLRGPPMDRATA